ncbi:MAG: hypothetical protein J0L99_17690 [Chitinophagales bacterium]|nr:hypothetical protein [Chitinophagales bacterium]
MSKKHNLYLGKAGQFVIMSELLCRGWNVAIPEVDVGDDIFVVRDINGDLIRVQVKTASGRLLANQAVQAQFNINIQQLKTISPPLLVYAFVIRFADTWQKPILIRQNLLNELYQLNNIGSSSGNQLFLRITVKDNLVSCGNINLSEYLNSFQDFPIILH